MRTIQCEMCGGRTVAQPSNGVAQVYHLRGPWPVTYWCSVVECNSCGRPMVHQRSSFSSTDVVWPSSSEVILPGDDYQVVSRGHGPHKLDGRTPVVATWAFHPLSPDNTEVFDRICQQIKQDDASTRESTAHVLLLPPNANMSMWLPIASERFAETWLLDKRVMLGAAGPYPSLRAERSIVRSIIGLIKVRHVWPAARLNERGYLPIATDDGLAQMWSQHSRRSIHIEMPGKQEGL